MEEAFQDFVGALSSRLCIIDIRILNGTEFESSNCTASLAFDSDESLQILIKKKYIEFLHSVLTSLNLLDEAEDIFISQIPNGDFKVIKETLMEDRKEVKIYLDKNAKAIHFVMPRFLCDLAFPVLAQVHEEVMLNCAHISQFKGFNMFLNVKHSTPESQYIAKWVANCFDIRGLNGS